jgi:aryl-alcohol dehydrogenase-like predicted oxidoreductase
MEKRRFGRTDHLSTVAIFGTAAFYEISQSHADEVMEYVLSTEINHIDIAPGYGQAEERMGPWLAKERDRFFLGCKTQERTKNSAAKELRHSLAILQVDRFDLFQLHAVTNMDELDQVTAKDGALQAILEAKEEGLTKHIGITGHGFEAPKVFLEALDRFDFDTVLFPVNFILYANQEYRESASALLDKCNESDVGTMIIKSIARGPWGERNKTHTTWYRPFTDKDWIQKSINFALSQPVTGICTAADVNLLPLVVDVCENFSPLDANDQQALIARADEFDQLFT